jgi:acylphosphatase
MGSPRTRRLCRNSESSTRLAVDQVSRRFRITGKVQGVYFRHSTRVQAQRLRLCGYARNLPDGSVEVMAQGADAAVEELRQWLHRGPKHARVEGVQELALEASGGSGAPAEFEVR